MNFLTGFNLTTYLKLGVAALIIAAFSYFLWDWHYSVIKELNRAIAQKEQLLEKSKTQIEELSIKLAVTEDNLKEAGVELNICKLEQEAYTPINTKIKDTENEGYFIY